MHEKETITDGTYFNRWIFAEICETLQLKYLEEDENIQSKDESKDENQSDEKKEENANNNKVKLDLKTEILTNTKFHGSIILSTKMAPGIDTKTMIENLKEDTGERLTPNIKDLQIWWTMMKQTLKHRGRTKFSNEQILDGLMKIFTKQEDRWKELSMSKYSNQML